jgi:hypothetical protein
MKIPANLLTDFAFNHRHQPPIDAISTLDKYQKTATGTEYPDEWFIRVTLNNDIHYPKLKSSGIYALSRIGLEANRGLLEQEYNRGARESKWRDNWGFLHCTWQQYESHLNMIYDRFEEQIARDVVAFEQVATAAKELHRIHVLRVSPNTQHIAFLRAQHADIQHMLSQRTSETDPLGAFQLTEQLLQVEDELRSLGVTDFT